MFFVLKNIFTTRSLTLARDNSSGQANWTHLACARRVRCMDALNHAEVRSERKASWIPACAGMTKGFAFLRALRGSSEASGEHFFAFIRGAKQYHRIPMHIR